MKTNVRRCIASLLVVSITGFSVPGRADMIAAGAVSDKERITAVLERAEARAQLAARGVDPAQLQARVAALTDEEAALLAAKADELPAGGFAFAVLAFIPAAIAIAVLLPIALVVGGIALATKLASQGSQPAGQDAGDGQRVDPTSGPVGYPADPQ